MFRSLDKSVNYPQWEHARVAAWLAAHWGNADTPQPELERSTLLRGVLMHDRGYGLLDNDPLRAVSEERWMEIMQLGIEELDPEGPDVDRVVLLHIARLLGDTPEGKALREGLAADGRWMDVDCVTNVCDRLSLQLCFEQPSTYEVKAQVAGTPRTFHCELVQPGQLTCHPWPFSVPEVRGHLLGYERDGYPERLQPVLLEWTCRPTTP